MDFAYRFIYHVELFCYGKSYDQGNFEIEEGKTSFKKLEQIVFGNVIQQGNDAKLRLQEVQHRMSVSGYSENLFRDELEAHDVLDSFLRNQELLRRDKGRVKWKG